ncbi:hypothetical protein FV139_02950 [Parahaliea maris]|uniref:Uncharacterized protein n=1 Tax=Parahaliea maris TaxID=2716870 RepID=A0A5C9A6P5_9GAMM|nr:hypothetical protein FV139_02950 [Parahaliea maris]
MRAESIYGGSSEVKREIIAKAILDHHQTLDNSVFLVGAGYTKRFRGHCLG